MSERPSRRRFIGIAAAAAGLALPPLGAIPARASAPIVTWRGAALGAPAEMTLHHPDRAAAEQLIRRAVAEIGRLERIFSLHRADSALAELNRSGVLAAPPPELVALLDICRNVRALSGGAFDPTIQPLWLLYARHFSAPGADATGPSPQAIEGALALVGFDRVAFDRSRIVLAQRGMALTLDGVAQGFITDRIVELLRAGGITSTLADIGEIRALGRRGDGRPWRVALAGDDDSGRAPLDLVDRAIATSSADGFRFAGPGSAGHLLDPRSGQPAARYRRVSVLAAEAVTADALSTAFSFLEPDRIAALQAALPGIEVDLLAEPPAGR